MVVLRGVDAFRRLESAVYPSQSGSRCQHSLEHVMSPTPELAFRLMTILFSNDELFADDEARPLLPYLPPMPLANTTRHQVSGSTISRPRL